MTDEQFPDFSLEVLPSQCFYQLKDNFNQTLGTFPCEHWTYDRSIFGKTFTEEAHLVCQYSIQRPFLATMLQIGAMFIFFTGRITDMIGRRRTIQLLTGLIVITSIITQGLLQYVSLSAHQK
jgi:MFS family permease